MSIWGWFIFGVAALWLAPGSLFRPVALVLLLGWVTAEGWYQATGDKVPMRIYLPFDFVALATIVLSRSHWSDWLIVPLIWWQWWWYGQVEDRQQWIWLYWLSVAQFLIAGPWPQLQRMLFSVSHGPLRPNIATDRRIG